MSVDFLDILTQSEYHYASFFSDGHDSVKDKPNDDWCTPSIGSGAQYTKKMEK